VQFPDGETAPLDGVIPTGTDPASPFSVYLHIPFCTVRCGYCDFNTYTASELRGVTRQSFVDDLIAEIRWSAGVLASSGIAQRPASTVFFGGGTPSLLDPADIGRILHAVRDVHGIRDDAEVSLEANPDTLTQESAAALVAQGVTRFSIGMQSAVPRVLSLLDRSHNPASVADAVAAARSAGAAVSVDVIYGTPGETREEWAETLRAAIALDTDHISAYSLIIEPGTALERRVRRGELAPVDDDAHADFYELTDDALTAAGFEWYEVSNWSTAPETQSNHNLAYWTGTDWWGYGPGAHSHIGGTRWWNVKHPAAYAERVSGGISPALEREVLSVESRHTEKVMLESRIRRGLNLDVLSSTERGRIGQLIEDGLIDATAVDSGRLVLTRRGRLLADAVVRAVLDD
jgi:putative oxygen-independent coproporphyrinogen III oxidase